VYKPAATDPWTWQGKIYGVGNELNTCVLAYRQDLMDEAGVQTPFENWDQVIAAGQEVSTGDRKMFALHDLAFGDHYMLSQSAGTSLFDAEGNYIGDNEESVAALQFLHDMVYESGIASIAPAVASDNWYPPQYREAFAAERFVALFGPPWHLSFLPTDVKEQSGKWTVQKLPAGLGEGLPTANFGGTGQCVTTQSQNPDAAYDLVRIANLTTEGVIADFEARTAYPAYRPAYGDPALQEPNEYFGGQKLGQIYSELAPELPPFQPVAGVGPGHRGAGSRGDNPRHAGQGGRADRALRLPPDRRGDEAVGPRRGWPPSAATPQPGGGEVGYPIRERAGGATPGAQTEPGAWREDHRAVPVLVAVFPDLRGLSDLPGARRVPVELLRVVGLRGRHVHRPRQLREARAGLAVP
jgi:arabinosaccharide transport system substrate-binding protein